MKRIFLTSVLAIAVLFACEKENPGPPSGPESDAVGLKSANIDKNEVIENKVLESLYGYFEGLEMKDYDLMRALAHENMYALEQGVLCDGVEEHIAWFESLGMPPVGVYNFDLEIVDIFVKGNVAWVIFYDHLYIGGDNVWNGLESGTFVKTEGMWKLAMMTVDNLAPCPECP